MRAEDWHTPRPKQQGAPGVPGRSGTVLSRPQAAGTTGGAWRATPCGRMRQGSAGRGRRRQAPQTAGGNDGTNNTPHTSTHASKSPSARPCRAQNMQPPPPPLVRKQQSSTRRGRLVGRKQSRKPDPKRPAPRTPPTPPSCPLAACHGVQRTAPKPPAGVRLAPCTRACTHCSQLTRSRRQARTQLAGGAPGMRGAAATVACGPPACPGAQAARQHDGTLNRTSCQHTRKIHKDATGTHAFTDRHTLATTRQPGGEATSCLLLTQPPPRPGGRHKRAAVPNTRGSTRPCARHSPRGSRTPSVAMASQ